jgi:uncharacterized protein
MKAILLCIGLMIILGAGCLKESTPASVTTTDIEQGNTATNTSETPPHPVSIKALMATNFNGREFTLDGVLAEEDTYTRYAISYLSGDLRITGIMNVPKGNGPFPVIFMNHGYIDPAVYTNGRGLRREQDYFARQGFVVIHSDYRNHAGSDDDPEYQNKLRLGYAEDVINAVVAVKAAQLPYIDIKRIGMLGHSMGGGIAQAVAVVDPDLLDAIVLYAPVSGDAWENFERYTSTRPSEANKILELYGSMNNNPDFWSGASAANYYANIQTPIMIHIGTNDTSTPIAWSETIQQKLKNLDKDVVLHIYEDETHEFGPEWNLMMERSLNFMRENLN